MPDLVKSINTMFFMEKTDVPINRWRDITYGKVVVDYIPEKRNTYRTIINVDGGRVNYPVYCSTPTVDLTTVKILLNIIVSTPNSKLMTIDVKHFYLKTPMARIKYMHLKLSNLPERVAQHYNLEAKSTRDGYVYVEIKRGMYGIPQSGLIVQQLL